MPSLTSVVIPAFNAARTLANAVDSVRRQQGGRLEIIVIDDGSTDSTEACCRALGADVRYVHQDNAGVAAARNAGLQAAHGDRITFLDADDEWPAGGLFELEAALSDHPEWMGVQGMTAAFTAELDGPVDGGSRYGAAWFGPQLGSTLFRREVFDLVGPFDTLLRVAEDLDWFIRSRECGAMIGQIAPVTLHYRLHAGSLTRGLDPVNKNLMLVLKRALDRRREAARASQGTMDRTTSTVAS